MKPHVILITLGDGLGWTTPGIAGSFQDPEGHLWEVTFNPGFADGG